MASPPDPASLDRPWVGSYPPGVPPTYPLPAVRLPRLLDDAVRDFPGHTGVIVGRTELTFEELGRNVSVLDRALRHQGIGEGDRVLLVLPTGLSLLITLVALWRRGAVAVPIPHDTPAQRAAAVADEAEVVAVVGTEEAVRRLHRERESPRLAITVTGDEWELARRRLRVPRVRLHRPDGAGMLRRVRGGAHRHSPQSDGPGPVVALADLVQAAAAAVVTPDQPVLALDAPSGALSEASIGTVAASPATWVDAPALVAVGLGPGGASAVEHTHHTLLAMAFQSRLWIPDVQAARERMLIAEPLHDLVGLAIGVLAAVLSGATTILVEDPSPSELTRAIETHRPTLLVARARRLARLLDEGDAGKRDLTSLRVGLSVGEGLPGDVARELERLADGARIRAVAGCGDAAPMTHGQPVYGRMLPTTVGLPVTDTLAIVVDPDDLGEPCGVGQPGLLVVTGPQIPEVGAACVDGRSVDGWLVTDEIACVDEDGWFTFIGRRDELLPRPGLLPIPRVRLADALRRRSDVRDAEVVQVGDDVVAAVVAGRRRRPHPRDLGAHLATEFDERLLPDRILLVTELPRTSRNEVDRPALEQLLRELLAAPHPGDGRDHDHDGRTRR